PLLITEQAVYGMKRGSMIVDLAGSTGGNCALTRPGEEIDVNGVRIFAPLNLAATVPLHASQLYSRNLTSFLSILIKDGQPNLDFNDDIIGPSCAVHQGQAVEPRLKAALGVN
ncbi:MAG: NAD(P)(+) transhydrogenase (Re/Si-specific) subunit alpha, partial [Acidobacteriota bacterium]